MSSLRRCSRTACTGAAVATLTYVYADSTAVVGPLATYVEPHGYDLCEQHATTLTVPRGWAVLRQEADLAAARMRSADDLEALANAVREAARSCAPGTAQSEPGGSAGRRGHLRVLRSPS